MSVRARRAISIASLAGSVVILACAAPPAPPAPPASSDAALRETVRTMFVLGRGLALWLGNRNVTMSREEEAAYEQVARRRQAERPPVPSDYFEIADVPQVSRRDLEFLLRPEGKAPYVAEVELVDGWGHPLDVRIDFDNLLGEPVMTVRSAGPNGKFEGPRYRIGVIRPDSGTDDIVWSDGRGITWPDLRELIRTD